LVIDFRSIKSAPEQKALSDVELTMRTRVSLSKRTRSRQSRNCWSRFTDIAFFVFGRFRERYVTPGWDEPASLRNASASDEAETLYALLERQVGDGSLQERSQIVLSMAEDPGLADVGNSGCPMLLRFETLIRRS